MKNIKYRHPQVLKFRGRIRVSKEIKEAWNDALECHCGHPTCSPKTHRLCPECGKTMIFNSYFMNPEPTYNEFRWKVEPLDYISLMTRSHGTKERQAIHIKCSNNKGRYFCANIK